MDDPTSPGMCKSAWDDGCRCAPCKRAHRRDRYAANADQERMRMRENRAANAEAIRARDRLYYQRTISHRRASSLRYYHQNAEARSEYARRYRQSEAGRMVKRMIQQNRKATMLEASHGCVSVPAVELLLDATGGLCVYCSAAAEHMDHVHPLAEGGLHCVENLVPSCADCNLAKGKKILEHPPKPLLSCPIPLETLAEAA